MLMPERSVGSANYRYLYNGMEVDNEVSGNGNSYTTEFRQYDPRLGRWKSLDPLMNQFPWMSPYVAFDNNPVYYTDPFGLAAEGGGDDKEKGTRNPTKKANRFANRKKGSTLQYHSDGNSVTVIWGKRNKAGGIDVKGKVFKWNGKRNARKSNHGDFINWYSDKLDAFANFFPWVDAGGGGDNSGFVKGGITLVTEQEGLKQGPAIKVEDGHIDEVNADILGAGKGTQKIKHLGTYKDIGAKVKELAGVFKNGVKLKSLFEKEGDKEPILSKQTDGTILVVVYEWSHDIEDGSGWIGSPSNRTLNDVLKQYPYASIIWSAEFKEFQINVKAPGANGVEPSEINNKL